MFAGPIPAVPGGRDAMAHLQQVAIGLRDAGHLPLPQPGNGILAHGHIGDDLLQAK